MADITVTKKQNGLSLVMKQSDVLKIVLPENPTTGFKWIIEDVPDFIIDEDFEPADHAAPGNSGNVIFRLSPRRQGFSAEIFLELRKPWEKNNEPEDSFNCMVEVSKK